MEKATGKPVGAAPARRGGTQTGRGQTPPESEAEVAPQSAPQPAPQPAPQAQPAPAPSQPAPSRTGDPVKDAGEAIQRTFRNIFGK